MRRFNGAVGGPDCAQEGQGMAKRLTFRHGYPVDPDRLFAMATDLDVLDAVCRPWVQFDHLPSGPVHTGQHIDVALSIFGLVPAQPYSMQVVSCDRVARRMRSEEHGAGITWLVHELRVEPAGTGAILIDEVEIEAGWKTLAMALCAQILYRWRHRMRLRLLTAY
jgi:hypothetical protein